MRGHSFVLVEDGDYDSPHCSEVCYHCGALNTVESNLVGCSYIEDEGATLAAPKLKKS